jgi:hypothetical protein
VQNALLRQQLIVLRRSVEKPLIRDSDRLLMVLLAQLDSEWRRALHIVQPDTLGAVASQALHTGLATQVQAKRSACADPAGDGRSDPKGWRRRTAGAPSASEVNYSSSASG